MSDHSKKQDRRKLAWRLLTIATVVFLLVAGITLLFAPVREAKRLEQSLNDRFGYAGDYTPAVHGTIPPQRIESFIRIREAVRSECRDYQEVLNNLIELESIDSDEEMSDKEKASRGFKGFKSLFSAGPNMVEFMEARNSALLAEDMYLAAGVLLMLSTLGVIGTLISDILLAAVDPRIRFERRR